MIQFSTSDAESIVDRPVAKMEELVLLEQRDPAAAFMLNRPGRLNDLIPPLFQEQSQFVQKIITVEAGESPHCFEALVFLSWPETKWAGREL